MAYLAGWLGAAAASCLLACGPGSGRLDPAAPATPQPPENLPSQAAVCISDAIAERSVARQRKLIASMLEPGRSQDPSPLIESSCRKRVYRLGNYRIIVHLRPGQTRKVSSAAVYRPPGRVVPGPECMMIARRKLTEILAYGDRLLSSAELHYGDSWLDSDVGALSFLRCTDDQKPVASGLGSLVHELNHSLGRNGCVHEPISGEQVCFQFPAPMPGREIARMPRFMLGHGGERGPVAALQQTYLIESGKQGPATLFDEMVSYRLNAEVQARLLVERSTAGRPMQSRSHIWLPLFMFLSLRYLDELRSSDAALFERAFGPTTANRDRLTAFLESGELVVEQWLAALEATGNQPFHTERRFWFMYLDLKRQVSRGPAET